MPKISNVETLPILADTDLTEEERKEFSWIDDSSTVSWGEAEFFRYRDSVYCLSDFESTTVAEWDVQHTDSFFSAVLVKYFNDNEEVRAGLYLA